MLYYTQVDTFPVTIMNATVPAGSGKKFATLSDVPLLALVLWTIEDSRLRVIAVLGCSLFLLTTLYWWCKRHLTLAIFGQGVGNG